MYTRLYLPGHWSDLHVFNWHLGLSATERKTQVDRLLQTGTMKSAANGGRVVLGGDTNDWTQMLGRGRLGRDGFLCMTGTGQRATRTFPAWGPMGALDRAFMRGPMTSRHHFGSRLSLARQASDHLPLVIDFDPLPR